MDRVKRLNGCRVTDVLAWTIRFLSSPIELATQSGSEIHPPLSIADKGSYYGFIKQIGS